MSTRRLRMRRFFGMAFFWLVIISGFVGGPKDDWPDWLLGVVLAVVVAISVITTSGQRTPREWVVLGLIGITAVVALVPALG
jgi:CDP-diglyceride synthetase